MGFIPSGTTVTAVTPTSVTLSEPVSKAVPKGTNVIFTPNYTGTASGGPPVLEGLSTDWLTKCLTILGLGPSFTFGTTGFNLTQLKAAAAQVFATDQAAQDWLVDALLTIDNLYQIVKSVPLPSTNSQNFEFSLVEVLYARGFKSAADVTELSNADFPQALIGTVAYDLAMPIYNSAASISPPAPTPPSSGGEFQSVNSDGSLTNCIPPNCLSPLGPIAYLSEVLQVSESSTCETPLTPSATNTLGTVIAQRRGPLANLSASCANLETPLPLIDIVNECLEYLGSAQPPTGGTVYNTSADKLAGYALCNEDDCPKEDKGSCCHDPAKIFAALPEYSTPAIPTTNNQAVEPLVFNNLKVDFSSCHLPYSQALDVSRTYLRHFRTSRFEEIRTFRKCITEFVLDPISPPTGFQSYLWRLPARIETAIEYLGITPEEYTMLFQGTSPQPCGRPVDDNVSQTTGAVPTWELYGYASSGGDTPWTNDVVILPKFLDRTCLSYCEFLELWKSGFVTFTSVNRDADARNAQLFPDCEPCCLANYTIQFVTPQDPAQALGQLAVFIRLWRKLKEHCGDGYSFAHLADICQFLALFGSTGTINPEFIRQLAAFQMLRDDFNLPLVDPADQTTGTTGADRTHLLALWVGSSAKKWEWALGRLLQGIEHHAHHRHRCERRSHEFIREVAENLDALSRLAGFNPHDADRHMEQSSDLYAPVRGSAGEDVRVEFSSRRIAFSLQRGTSPGL